MAERDESGLDSRGRTRESYLPKEQRQIEGLGSLEKLKALLQADPERGEAMLRKLLAKQFIPHGQVQREVLDSAARFNILCAGRRFGKTQVGAARALKECRTMGGPKGNRPKTVWWVAPIYKNVKRGYEAVLNQLPPDLLTHVPPPVNAFDAGRAVQLRFKNGAKMEFYSAERPEGMLGGSCDFVILDEAATMPEHVWYQIIQPTLADRQGGGLMISTPRGRNWFYKLYQAGQDELQPDFASWRVPSTENPLIPREEWDRQREILPAVTYEQEVLADFVSASASVFRFEDESVVKLQVPEGHVVLGIDLAKYNDFSVLIGINSGNRVPCYHDRFNQVSWPEQRRRIHAAVEEILETAESITVLIDSTGLGDVIYDDLTDEGMDVVPIKFTPQWKHAAVQLLAADLERGHAFLCEDQVSEFHGYGYSISESTGRWKFEALSGHDDEVSAMLIAHWGVVHTGIPDIRMLNSAAPEQAFAVGEDYIDTDAIDDGEVTIHEISLPTVDDLMNNPSAWA